MIADRCVATNAAGARCIRRATHGNDHHQYADDSYRLGALRQAVKMYLAGAADRDFLAHILAQVESDAG